MPEKDKVAEDLIHLHFRTVPGLVLVYRVLNGNEDDPSEPIKLVEVSEDTFSAGAFTPWGFAPTAEFPFPTLIAEVLPEELEEWRREGQLPFGWDLSNARKYVRNAA